MTGTLWLVIGVDGGSPFEEGPLDQQDDGFAQMVGLLFLFVLIAGIGLAAWKVMTARRMAREAGMNQGDATAMTLLTDQGLEATYLASNLRQPGTPDAPAASTRPASERLGELQGLLDGGLITADEYDARRRTIIDGI